MTILIDNTEEKVKVSQNTNQTNKHIVKLAKKFKLAPMTPVDFHTGVYVECTDQHDECFIKGGIEDNNSIICTSDRVTREEGKIEVVITLYNPTEKAITIPEKCSIARLYSSVPNDGKYSFSDLNANLIYYDGNVLVRSFDDKNRSFTLETKPDGKRSLILELD